MNATSIEWTSFSANPLKYRDAAGRVVWGCVHASEGCRHCYSEALTKRYGRGGPFTAQVMKSLTPFLDDAELRHMLKAKVIGGVPVAGARCFVGDMTDLFGEWVPDELLDRLFAVFGLRDDVTWQVLTKRASRAQAYIQRLSRAITPLETAARAMGYTFKFDGVDRQHSMLPWPIPNVWLGVSVEDQATADERIPLLLQTPAAVRFVSLEPQLASVDVRPHMGMRCEGCGADGADVAWCPPDSGYLNGHFEGGPPEAGPCGPLSRDKSLPGLSLVIQGGESGPGARPFSVEWARDVRGQCAAAGTAYFMKQLGEHVHWNGIQGGGIPLWPDGLKWEEHDGAWCRRFHKKGGDQALMPEDLRVRELPS